MTDLPPDALDLIDVVRDHLGGKVTDDWAEGQDSLRFVLYEALAVSIDRDDYGSGRCWGISVILGEGFSVSDLLGSDLTLLETRDQFDKALDAVDAYARLRLGPEYLATFDATRTSG